MQPERTDDIEESFDRKYYWNKIFIASCLCALFVDPLFLYVPILKDDFKCLMLDPKLKIVVLLLRSLTDLFYLMDIIIRIYRSENYSGLIVQLNRRQHRMDFSFVLKSCVPRIAKTIWASNDILIDIVALLPFPQVAVLIFFSKMSDLRSLTPIRMVLMNGFALLQYMPRVFRIYLSSKELKRNLEEEIIETPIWIKGVLNFCMYIIASHVFGAMWYFFAIQRMMICWHFACRKEDGCDNRIFGCHDHHAFRNTTILNDLCPVNVNVNSSETMVFDFGIFATVLQYGIVGSTNYFKKFLICFWWGLRNLSSLGSNLEPSADGWENLYTIFISITGLLLFLYLIGNLQMYMQHESTRTDNRMQMKRKMKGKDKEVELWLLKRGIPARLIKDIKSQIMEKVKQAVQEDTYTSLDNILPLLPSNGQRRIEEHFAKLKQVPMLRGMDEGLLEIIYEKFEPVRCTENNFIIQKGEILEKMVYIVDGSVSIEERDSDDSSQGAGAGELFGEELLRWPFYSDFLSKQPLATESVKTIGVVEALALTAHDLKSIYGQPDIKRKEEPRHRKMMKEEVEQHMNLWIPKNGIPERLNKSIKSRIMENLSFDYWDTLPSNWYNLVSSLPLNFQDEIKCYMPLTKLKQVPMLRGMDEGLLEIIYEKFEPVRCTENNFIIQKGEILEKMVYIVDGSVSIEERDSDDSSRGAGELFGEELLRWPFYSYFPHRKPLATESVKAIGVVEALALNACEFQSIYGQPDIKRKEEPRHRKMMKEEVEQHMNSWIPKNGIPERLNRSIKSRIMENLSFDYWDTLPSNWYNLVSSLPLNFQDEIKGYMPLTKLKQVPMLRGMDEGLLEIIYEKFEPVRCTENNFIIQKGEILEKMVYIVDGSVSIEERDSDDSSRGAGAGELFGEELLRWPFYSDFLSKQPLATESVKAIGVVEALALNAWEFQSIYGQPDIKRKEEPRHRKMMKEEVEQHMNSWIPKNGIPERLNKSIKSRIMENLSFDYWDTLPSNWYNLVSSLPLNFQDEIKGYMPLTKLKQVPMFRGMDEGLLEIIYDKFEPVRCTENNFIIQKGEILEKMVYIVDGFVSIEERYSDYSSRDAGAGELFGEELLRWPFYSDFPSEQPLATESVKSIGVVEALALTAHDLKSIYGQPDIKRKEEPRHRKMMKEEVEQHMNSWIPKNGIPERLNKSIKSRIMEYLSFYYWNTLPSDWYILVSCLPLNFQDEIKSYMPLTKLKQMPEFQNMEESVLKQICRHLWPRKYRFEDHIIAKGDRIQMFFVVDGYLSDQSCNEKGPKEIYGEELLLWPFSTSFPHTVPKAAESPYAVLECTEVLALTHTYVERVATEFRKHFIKNYGRLVHVLDGPSFSYFREREIKDATRSYTCLNYRNEGDYGTVYRTELDGRAVAIKTRISDIGDPFIQSRRLVHEAFVLSQIGHQNVERLLGCCLETTWPIMVYDRTHDLTLVEHFHTNKSELSLESRMKIAAETARALAHVHSRSVIHRDVKTSNILIDQTTHTVKVTGFGASRLLDEDEGEMEDEVSTLPGTSRYLDPEYPKSQDVYSFGVVLVELLTRQEAVSSNGSETSLANDFVRSVQEDSLGQILDGEINTDKFSFEMAQKVSELAVTCLRSGGEERPSMEKVAEELEGLVQTIRNRVEHCTVEDNISSASRTSE